MSTPTTPDSATIANRPISPNGWPTTAGASTRNGQCHRYHEYDSRPTARIGDQARTRPHPSDGRAQPAAEHERGAQHGQQRRGTRIARARGELVAGQQESRPARPIP